MAEPRRPNPAPKRGPLGRLMAMAVGFAFWVVMGAFGNVVVEWLGMALVWPEQGVQHSWHTLAAELRYLDRDFPEGLFIPRPARLARTLMDAVHQTAYRDLKLAAAMQELPNAVADRDDGSGMRAAAAGRLSRMLGGGREYLLAAVIATQIYAIRLAVMVAAIPVFALAAFVAVADGFGQRDLRRFGGGRERGQVYHLARSFVFPLFTLPWVLYLSWPATVHPNFFVLPFAAAFGGVLWIMTGSFKKYL